MAQTPLVSLGRRASLHQGLSSRPFSELAKGSLIQLAVVKYGGKAKKMAAAPNLAIRLPKALGLSPWPSSPGTQRTTGHDRGANPTPLHPLPHLLLHQRLTVLRWAAFILRRQIPIAPKQDQRPRFFRGPTHTEDKNIYDAEIGCHG